MAKLVTDFIRNKVAYNLFIDQLYLTNLCFNAVFLGQGFICCQGIRQ